MKGYGEQIDEICAILDGAKVPEVVATTQTDLDGNSVEEFLHSPDRVRILVQERDALREHVAAEQQAQGDAEGLRAHLSAIARDCRELLRTPWDFRAAAEVLRRIVERCEVAGGEQPAALVKAEDYCPECEHGESVPCDGYSMRCARTGTPCVKAFGPGCGFEQQAQGSEGASQ